MEPQRVEWQKPELKTVAETSASNNGESKQAAPRRSTDPHEFDGRRLRSSYGNGNGNGNVPKPAAIQITLVGLLGLVVSILGTGGTMLTFGQDQIDRTIRPVVDEHLKRLERELDNLDTEMNFIFRNYVPRDERLRMEDDLKQRIDELRQGLQASAAQDLAAIEARTQFLQELNDIRRRVRTLENAK